jgi:hypothetical protein
MRMASSGRMLGPALAALALGALAGCATIMHGTSQGIPISSRPTGARVTVDTSAVGLTPVTASLGRKNAAHTITLELDGYEPFQMTTARSTSGWVWGNIVFGGLIGLAVDAMTGGLYNVKPETVYGELRQQGVTQVELKDGALLVILVAQPEPDWELIGQLSPRFR